MYTELCITNQQAASALKSAIRCAHKHGYTNDFSTMYMSAKIQVIKNYGLHQNHFTPKIDCVEALKTNQLAHQNIVGKKKWNSN